MDRKGPILVATALSLVASAGFTRSWLESRPSEPELIETQSTAGSCQQYGIMALTGGARCAGENDTRRAGTWERQQMRRGGALFVAATDSKD